MFSFTKPNWTCFEDVNANVLDVFCFKCLLHKQDLQVLPAYFNIKHPQNVLGNVPIMFSKDKTITLQEHCVAFL